MPSSKSGAVLFDLDGVLVDSQAPITGCINHALETHGLPAQPPSALLPYIGPPLALGFAELTGQPADSSVVTGCVSAYRARYREVSLRETTVVPGMETVLAKLARRHRLAVATSKPLVYAEPLLETLGLRQFFDFCAGPGLRAAGEQKSVTIAGALARIDCAGAVMVGDRSLDIVGAHRCAVPAVAVTWGIGSVEELSSARPEAIVELPEELPAAVAELLVERQFAL